MLYRRPQCPSIFRTLVSVTAVLCVVSSLPLLGSGFSSVERLVVFGDQLSDTGRVGGVAEADNTLWVEDLADLLFIETPEPYDPVLNPTGLNFSQVGATTVGDTPFDNGHEQIDLYQSAFLGGGQRIPENTLIVLWFGLNDILQNEDTAPVVDGIASLLTRLVNAGAERILLPTMIPLGRTPDKNSDVATWNAIASSFNAAIDSRLRTFQGIFRDIEIIRVDVYGLFEDIVAAPASYGILDYTSASSFSASAPETSLWWSLVSPTSLAHGYISDLAYSGLLQVLPGDASNVTVEVSISGSGTVNLDVRGPVLELVRIERSFDLENWKTIQTYAGFDGAESMSDFVPTSQAVYYRAW